MRGPSGIQVVVAASLVTMVSAGLAVAAPVASQAAVSASGLYSMGSNTYGELGDGTTTAVTSPTTTSSYSPVQVSGLTGAWQVAAGEDFVLALREDGTVWAWGGNGEGNLGDGTTVSHLVPEQVPGLAGIAQVAADTASFAVSDGGTLFSWGSNTFGMLGTGTSAQYTVSPAPVPGLTGVTQVATDGVSTLALREDGSVYSWGNNLCGELGDGTTTARSTPELIDQGPITQVAVGETFLFSGFSAAIEPNGTLLTWGCNGDGQLGQGVGAAPRLPRRSPT